MFKEVKPAGQPRTLRSIVEQHNEARNFVPDVDPDKTLGDGSGYRDAALAALPTAADARRKLTSADKMPFKNLK